MNTTIILLLTLSIYFAALCFIARRYRATENNDNFFRAGRRSPWWMVGFGMIGASISGVSFISVPGWVASTGMTYLQMCAGFFFGYLAVAFVLLPLYYRLQLTSIYDYLLQRFGHASHLTGAWFFLLSKLTGAAIRLYLVCAVMVTFLFPFARDAAESIQLLLFAGTITVVLLLIRLYTRRSGLLAIVRTDALQTLCLLLSLVLVIVAASERLGFGITETWQCVMESPMSRIIETDANSSQAFWRQFLSGIFIVIVMTGLDQDMMQKNLTCRTLREAQKNMCAYGACFLPVNFLLLGLGILLYTLCTHSGIAAPEAGDELLPMLVADGHLGTWVVVPFTIGIVAAAFSSADSAITALTTTVCIDLLGIERRRLTPERQVQVRRRIHTLMFVLFLVFMLLFRFINNTNVINSIYVLASYTYGPLLGLFSFGLFTHRRLRDRLVPIPALLAPICCGLLDTFAPLWWGYHFGYELLLLNGLLTFAGLWMVSKGETPGNTSNRV